MSDAVISILQFDENYVIESTMRQAYIGNVHHRIGEL